MYVEKGKVKLLCYLHTHFILQLLPGV